MKNWSKLIKRKKIEKMKRKNYIMKGLQRKNNNVTKKNKEIEDGIRGRKPRSQR